MDKSIPLEGNAFLDKEQAQAVADATDAIFGLVNEHRIHPCYVVGILEAAQHALISQSFELCEKGLWK